MFYASCINANVVREYNYWYEKNGVMFDITQTSDGSPVMLSIYAPGKKNSNMVISYYSHGSCHNADATLKVDSSFISATYSCVRNSNKQINHFVITDANHIDYIVNKLKSGFTVLLQDEIKVWAANFNSPRFGIMPNVIM